MPPVPPPPPSMPLPPPSGPPPGFAAAPGYGVPAMMAGRPTYHAPAYRPQLRAVTAAPPIRPPQPRAPAPDRSAAAAQHTRAAGPTVKRVVPAQHNPALKALVPASVRIQRERQVVPPSKRPRLLHTATTTTAPAALKPSPSDEKQDASYLEFLDEMRGVGAFE